MNQPSNHRRLPLARRIVLALAALIAHRRRRPRLRAAEVHRVLLMRHDRIGDAVISTPLIDALRTAIPGIEIDILGSPGSATLFAGDPRIAEVIVLGGSLTERLRAIRAGRRRHYDAVFQLVLGRTTLPALLAAAIAGRGRTIGKSVIGHERLFDHVVATGAGHYSERTFALINGIAFDMPIDQPPYHIAIPDAVRTETQAALAACGLRNVIDREHGDGSQPGFEGDRGLPFALLNISAGEPAREWPIEVNIEIAQRIAHNGLQVAVISSPDARHTAQAIAEAAGAYALPTRSILAAAAIAGAAEIVITPDTSIVHIASARARPVVVACIGTYDVVGWAPHGVPYAVVDIENTALRPADAIVEAVDALMRSNEEGRP